MELANTCYNSFKIIHCNNFKNIGSSFTQLLTTAMPEEFWTNSQFETILLCSHYGSSHACVYNRNLADGNPITSRQAVTFEQIMQLKINGRCRLKALQPDQGFSSAVLKLIPMIPNY